MIVSETQNGTVTVRIHDECVETESKERTERLNDIVRASYKRRHMAQPEEKRAI